MLTELGFLSMEEFTRLELEAAAWANRITDAVNQTA
jgi:EAL and modified HD-GYP domain-containing signal transduction protein